MSTKPTLVLLHGALGSSHQLIPLERVLMDYFEIHKLNFSGHGGNTLEGVEFSIDLFSEDLANYLKSKRIVEADIFGYSMGGYVALNLAKQLPSLVGRLFTLGTKFHWTAESALHETKMLNPQKIKEKVPAFAAALEKRHHPESWERQMSKTANMMLALGNGKAMIDEDFAAIQHQVLITVGSEDKMVSAEESEHVANLLPNAQFEVIPNWDHPIEKVDIEELSERIRQFFL